MRLEIVCIQDPFGKSIQSQIMISLNHLPIMDTRNMNHTLLSMKNLVIIIYTCTLVVASIHYIIKYVWYHAN